MSGRMGRGGQRVGRSQVIEGLIDQMMEYGFFLIQVQPLVNQAKDWHNLIMFLKFTLGVEW